MSPRVANRKSEKLYAFVKMSANMKLNSFILNIFIELACSEQDIVVQLQFGVCVLCLRALQICPGHNFYICACISK